MEKKTQSAKGYFVMDDVNLCNHMINRKLAV